MKERTMEMYFNILMRDLSRSKLSQIVVNGNLKFEIFYIIFPLQSSKFL